MRIRFEKPSRENSEFEIIAVSLALLAIAVGWAIPLTGIRLPACNFHRITGYSCPTCGATRACLLLAHLDVQAAFKMNPLVAALATAAGLAAVYSTVVLAFRLPRVRVTFSSRRQRRIFWIALAVAALLNWAYLIGVDR